MIIQDDSVKKLQEQIQGVMPLLTKNLEVTYDLYMKSGVPGGAYDYVLERHKTAAILANADKIRFAEGTTPDDIFRTASPLFIDLRAMADDLTGAEKAEAELKMADLRKLFHENGFTKDHLLLDIPIKPTGDRHVPA